MGAGGSATNANAALERAAIMRYKAYGKSGCGVRQSPTIRAEVGKAGLSKGVILATTERTSVMGGSRNAAVSSICSARSLLSLAFSFSRCFGRSPQSHPFHRTSPSSSRATRSHLARARRGRSLTNGTMLFNSEAFLFVFLPVVQGGFHALRRLGANNASLWFLFAASAAFYGFWNPANLWILCVSIAMNYAAATAIVARPGRAALAAGVTANLLLLAYFKYRNFILSNAGLLWGGHYRGEPLDLPLGICFYTFTQIAFLVDLAMRRTERSSPRTTRFSSLSSRT